MNLDSLGISAAVAIAGIFVGWFFVGAAVNRRRITAAARWVNRGLGAYRESGESDASLWIKWLATNAFVIMLEGARAPFRGVSATVLLQSRDMITVWLMDRFTGRRDLLMLRCDLRLLPIWGLEIFRPRSVLAGDVRRRATTENWSIGPCEQKGLLAAHGGGQAAQLCAALLRELGDDSRRLVRLGVSRQAPQLTLAIDLPNPVSSDAVTAIRMAERLANITADYSTA